MGAPRSPEEIRRSIEANRAELGLAISRLRTEIDGATDWRSTLNRHRNEALIAAGVLGFVFGGGTGAVFSLLFGSRRRDDDD
jgi:hypothetical protein